jgi:hypothetical protein
MTKASAKFAQKIAAKLANIERIGDILIIRPTTHIVRGFLFERTPSKNDFYLWALISPLFCPSMKNLSLNYSHRIHLKATSPAKVSINCAEEIISDLCATLEQEHVPYLSSISTPGEFLHELEPKLSNHRDNMDLDFAMAHCIAGDFETGKVLLEKLLVSTSTSPILPRVQASARSILASLEGNHAEFWALVDLFERENVRLHFPGLTRQLEN